MTHLVAITPSPGEADSYNPVRDLVYVDALSGSLAGRRAQIHSALNRQVHTANNRTTLPGTLERGEGAAATSDAAVNSNYALLGDTYACFRNLFGRDSFNGAGARLVSSVHVGTSWNNAQWDGVQMAYGDGDGVAFGNFAQDFDITTHELTHAVTEAEANLKYESESGALNESMSDIFAAVCSANRDGLSANTWLLGEVASTPGTAGDALRYLADPRRDGISADYYPTRGTTSAACGGGNDNCFVHTNSGISNLAFHLAAQGGQHPRGATSITVPGLGINKAAQIWYRALNNYMTTNTDFAGARAATALAAFELFGGNESFAVQTAWKAVGVADLQISPNAIAPAGANIAASARSAMNLDTFVIDAQGALSSSFWAGGKWGHARLTGINLAPPGGGLASVARTSNDLDLFYVGNDGALWRAYFAGNRWNLIPITAAGFAPAGAQVAAVSRGAYNLDVFVVGNNGALWTAFWSGGGWGTHQITGTWLAPAGAPVAVASQDAGKLDVFVVGWDGALSTSFWSGGGWGTAPVTQPRFMAAQTAISVTSRAPGKLDLFMVGSTGAIVSAWWTSTNGWGIAPITAPSLLPARARISVAARMSDKLDLFYTANDGAVYSTWFTEQAGKWSTFRMTSFSVAPVGAPVAVAARTPTNLDTFVVGSSGAILSQYWTPTSGWLQ